jgi:mannan endo-1,4-beta-mannosidase
VLSGAAARVFRHLRWIGAPRSRLARRLHGVVRMPKKTVAAVALSLAAGLVACSADLETSGTQVDAGYTHPPARDDASSAPRDGGATADASFPTFPGDDDAAIPAPADPSHSPAALAVLGYLKSIWGTKTLAGQHNREPNDRPTKWTDTIHTTTGKYPAMWGGDFLYQKADIDARQTMIDAAKAQWKKGAVVNLMYHACPPTQPEACAWEGGVKSALTDAQWKDLTTDGGALNQVWKSRLDTVVPYLRQLKDAGVVALFRPHHEMNQGVFWWGGRTGAGGTARLFRITHDYLVKTKKLDNLLWVWSVQDLSENFGEYDPGRDVWDVMALDVYNPDGLTKKKYQSMLAASGGKPIAIGECQTLPRPSELAAQPKWLYFLGWSELVYESNSDQAIKSTYAAPSVLTLDRMPGW